MFGCPEHQRALGPVGLALLLTLTFLPMQAARSSVDTVIDALEWRLVGPWRGGRVNAVAGHPTDKNTFFAGYTGGGVWKTDDGGLSWQNVSDGHFAVGSIGAMDISDSHPEVIYVGTGEQALRGDVSHGDGVYKSTDGGKTWANVGLTDTRQIAELLVHPTDPDIVYVAALGHFAGPNGERGVFKTTDGGESWQRVLFVDENTGAVGLALDESNPDRLIAGMWDVRRFPWGIRSAGPGSSLHRTKDGGATWEDISAHAGLPQGLKERMDVSISQSQPNRIWALMSAEGGRGLYRSDDFGDNWRKISNHAELTGRTYYFQKLLADPADEDVVYVMNWNILVSRDGGETFEIIPSGHADHHAFWIDPEDNQRIIDGSDGGAQITFNGGKSWSTLYNQPTGQFYTLTLDEQEPYNLYGSQQDWSTLIVPSLAREADPRGYFDTGYSEAGHVAVSHDDPNVLYISDHHWLLRYDRRTDAVKYVGPRDETNYGIGTRDIKYRFNWTFPVVTSIHDRRTVYAGSQYLHRSRDNGDTWEILGPDLTRADPDKLEITPEPGVDTSGNDRYWGPLTRDSNGDHWFSTLYTIAESPLSRKTIWTGSDDGVVHVSRDGGQSWSNVTPPGLPDYAMVTRIEASSHDQAVAYFTASAYKLDDYRPFMFRTDDFGETWQKITTGIDEFEILRVVREDPEEPGILYAGGESGMYLSLDSGNTWRRPDNGFPATPIYDMKVEGESLVAATHGRGFWAFDHLGTVRQLVSASDWSAPALFTPAPTVRRDGDWAEDGNPAQGVLIQYWLPQPATALELEVADARGRSIATFMHPGDDENGPCADAGFNAFEWDLRYPNAAVVPGVVTRGDTDVSPVAVPGRFQVRMLVDGATFEAPFEIRPDPNVAASQRDLEEQFRFLSELRDSIDELNRAVIEVRALANSVDGMSAAPPEARRILEELRLIEQHMVQPKARYRKDLHANPVRANDKLYRLANFVARSHSRPTAVQYALKTEFESMASQLVSRFEALKDNEIEPYNTLAAEEFRIEAEATAEAPAERDQGASMPR
ncbi:MAG: glycosyl hydrolase [Pseudomonadota bacterium]